ncbi:hypothetical protein BZA77DRAFT_82052 [Pyronema omphalodes]|nr:hypothetical protein BZA77DRAFT_82052 [Pyronema omphalodes]
MPINTCILGYGLSARTFQIPYIQLLPQFHLHSILQRTPTADNNAAQDHPGVKVYNNINDVCADPEIQLVIVSVANSVHYSITKQLLEAGKDVVVEKPFTVKAEEADELCQLAREKNRVLTVFQNRRWDADFQTLQTLLSEKKLGEIVSLESHFDRYKSPSSRKESWKTVPQPGNGVLFDLGAHLVDQVLTLFGLPHRIYGNVRDERGNSQDPDAKPGQEGFIDDAFDAVLYYDKPLDSSKGGIEIPKRGMVVKVSASQTSLCEKQVRFIVRGTEAGWVKYGLDLQEDQTKAGVRVEDQAFGRETEEMWGTLTRPDGSEKVESKRGFYRGFFENLATAIEDGRETLKVKPEEAADVVRVLEAVVRSELEGRVVTLQ